MSKLICEQAIYQEAELIKSTGDKAIFRSVIQSADDENRNKRVYPMNVLNQGMNDCRERMSRRAFVNELDHPIPSGNKQFDAMRQTTVLLDQVSHIIRDYQFEGTILKAEMETTSTPKGNILAGLMKDRSGIGFSMRGLGSVDHMGGRNVVQGPLTIISYDAVSRPSHQGAVVDFREMKFESENLLQEGEDLIDFNGHVYLPNYFDKLVEQHLIQFMNRWV